MQLATVIGFATSTVKHESLDGWRMIVCQPLNAARAPEADPVIAFSKLQPGVGQTVVINSDGKGARETIGHEKTPARWYVIGIENA